jgi:hypothetical protein
METPSLFTCDFCGQKILTTPVVVGDKHLHATCERILKDRAADPKKKDKEQVLLPPFTA